MASLPQILGDRPTHEEVRGMIQEHAESERRRTKEEIERARREEMGDMADIAAAVALKADTSDGKSKTKIKMKDRARKIPNRVGDSSCRRRNPHSLTHRLHSTNFTHLNSTQTRLNSTRLNSTQFN